MNKDTSHTSWGQGSLASKVEKAGKSIKRRAYRNLYTRVGEREQKRFAALDVVGPGRISLKG